MQSKVVVLLAAVLCLLLVSYAHCEPLVDTLPDTTGLFFGKRSSHPNMNNLLFGRRSSYAAQLAAKLDMAEARRYCEAVTTTCAKLGLED